LLGKWLKVASMSIMKNLLSSILMRGYTVLVNLLGPFVRQVTARPFFHSEAMDTVLAKDKRFQ
jgi:hypothetical protein